VCFKDGRLQLRVWKVWTWLWKETMTGGFWDVLYTRARARASTLFERILHFHNWTLIYEMSVRCCELEAIKLPSFCNVRVSNIASHVQRNLTIPPFIRPDCCTYTANIPGLVFISRHWGSELEGVQRWNTNCDMTTEAGFWYFCEIHKA
jgi:hypothetical protein